MLDYNVRLIQKQSETITELNAIIVQLHARIENLKPLQAPGKRYIELIKQIQENPILQSEWERFLAFLKISAADEYLEKNNAHSN